MEQFSSSPPPLAKRPRLSNEGCSPDKESDRNVLVTQLAQTVEELRARQATLEATVARLTSAVADPAPAESPALASIVVLNVGGVHYTTTRATLCQYPDTMLGAMFSGKYALTLMKDGSVFIDRDGQLFQHVLQFLRSQRWVLPSHDAYQTELIKCEADYFGLPWPLPEFLVETAAPSKRLEAHMHGINAMAVAGDFLVTASGSMRVWDKDGNRHFELDRREIRAVLPWRDGILAVSKSGGMHWYNDSFDYMGRYSLSSAPPDNTVETAVLWRDSVAIACLEDQLLRVWHESDIDTVLPGDHDFAEALDVWDDNLVAGLADGNINLWAPDFKNLHTLSGHRSAVICLVVWNSKLCSGSMDKTVRLWSAGPHWECTTVIDTGRPSFAMAVWHDSLVTSDFRRSLAFWNEQGECRRTVTSAATVDIRCLCVWHDGDMLVTGNDDGEMCFWRGTMQKY
eukprot:TRINITY_DN1313_c1_g1_i1.p1 TRINITY_DN1313_c1_g1~~TRINITY_DN1313_c1_g1_i1.p1  ORF type:complete len:455 (-),score=147.77 TRINITY_DN1313_c1_g1_i1:114-1478(-)